MRERASEGASGRFSRSAGLQRSMLRRVREINFQLVVATIIIFCHWNVERRDLMARGLSVRSHASHSGRSGAAASLDSTLLDELNIWRRSDAHIRAGIPSILILISELDCVSCQALAVNALTKELGEGAGGTNVIVVVAVRRPGDIEAVANSITAPVIVEDLGGSFIKRLCRGQVQPTVLVLSAVSHLAWRCGLHAMGIPAMVTQISRALAPSRKPPAGEQTGPILE
jgi:hypothetical protein